MPIKCHLCPATTESIDSAENEDWWPSYMIGDQFIEEPICPDCVKSKQIGYSESNYAPILK